MDSTSLPKGRNVKSGSAVVTDAHERRKDFLNETEIADLLEAAKRGRHGTRDHLLMLMTYRHGLRVSEAIGLRRDDIDLDQARLWVRRLKNGLAVEQPITGDELRAIKRHLAARLDRLPWLFVSERGQTLTRQTVNYLIASARACSPVMIPLPLKWGGLCLYLEGGFSRETCQLSDTLGRMTHARYSGLAPERGSNRLTTRERNLGCFTGLRSLGAKRIQPEMSQAGSARKPLLPGQG